MFVFPHNKHCITLITTTIQCKNVGKWGFAIRHNALAMTRLYMHAKPHHITLCLTWDPRCQQNNTEGNHSLKKVIQHFSMKQLAVPFFILPECPISCWFGIDSIGCFTVMIVNQADYIHINKYSLVHKVQSSCNESEIHSTKRMYLMRTDFSHTINSLKYLRVSQVVGIFPWLGLQWARG